MAIESAFLSALKSRAGIDLIKSTSEGTQLRLVIRVPKGQGTTIWLTTLLRINNLAKNNGWGIDVSKQYFNASEGDLRYQWRIILQSSELVKVLQSMTQEVMAVQVRPQQIEEVQLVGSPRRSKTAGIMGTVPIGPRIS